MASATDMKQKSHGGKGAFGPLTRSIHLAPREVLTMRAGEPGLHIVSEGSVLWITQDGKPEDYILHPGEHYTMAQPGRVVIQGMCY